MMEKSPPSNPQTASDLFDEMLVVMAQRGDRLALERLYRRWNARLTRTARRYCGQDCTAQDLAQECWLAILKGLGGLRDPKRFRSYAFAVLHRRGADHLRKVMRERGSAGDPGEESTMPPQSESAAIAQAFASLPPDQRLAAHLYFIEGLTLGEIAAVQSIPEGTAKSRLFHARRKLKAALSDTNKGVTQ
ncbi:RNA polymerase sigma factor [Qipengyuania sp. ASV99]|uniref:RNA polymerase sigma factor n=1 Tax=Qipengyuania sp. ASV99 TaxID=3399681 RepID=UPI003A4C6DFC